jgi:hypothetical protein
VNTEAPWPDANTARQRVLKIQTKLHQWATDDPGRRFDDLSNLVYDPAVLAEAWHRVRSNRGARTAGIDWHGETWSEANLTFSGYSPERLVRLVVTTIDPATLPAFSSWYLPTNLPQPGSS